ncbi:MAG: putative toxin-antitoxin system toxin component, PIN family [Crocosphaera sp.]
MSVSLSQDRCFIDSNIWLYALLSSEGQEDQRKAILASNIIQTQKNVVSTQVINEVSVNLIKKNAIKEEQLSNLIQSFYQKYKVVEFNLNILLEASKLRQKYRVSFWDSLIIASALSGQANYLYSEDMQHGLIVAQKLEIINPFLAAT